MAFPLEMLTTKQFHSASDWRIAGVFILFAIVPAGGTIAANG
jgi:hypothetical protein